MRPGILFRLALLAPLGSGVAVAAPRAADRIVDPAEVAAFRAANDRFGARLEEIVADTRAFISFREAEEKAHIEERYAAPINALETQRREQRLLGIERFETFLRNYPSATDSDQVRIRLADLYYQESLDRYLVEAAEYNQKLDQIDALEAAGDMAAMAELLEGIGTEPKRDFGQSLALYQQIVERNRSLPPAERYENLDDAYVLLGSTYNDDQSAQHDPQKARATFSELVNVLPDSDVVDRSHLFLGGLAFAANQYDEALAEYRTVVEKGESGDKYEEALYQLAWTHSQNNDYRPALDLFAQLLDRAERTRKESGKESSFARDARRFMAFNLADLAYDKDVDALDYAKEYFGEVGQKPYERDVYIQLTEVLDRYSRTSEALAVYDHLQDDERWKLSPDNPKHQMAIVNLHIKQGDLEMMGSERLEFIQKYAEGTEWFTANRARPDAQSMVQDYIEDSLLQVALDYRVRAQDSATQDPAQYLQAAEKYQEYLDKFPLADDYYLQQFFLADSLRAGKKLEEARREYESLLKSRGRHPFYDASLASLLQLHLDLMSLAGHLPDEAPADAQVERTYETPAGEIQVLALSQDRKDFIEASDRVLAHEFGPPTDEKAPDVQEQMKAIRPAAIYITGQIYFFHNQFEKAREYFLRLIKEHHNSLEANYAAGLVLDSYKREGNLEAQRDFGDIINSNPPGPPGTYDPSKFLPTVEHATFKLALEEGLEGDPLVAAEKFLAFRERFPRSTFAIEALYNAGHYMNEGGKASRAIELFKQFVAEYPNDKRSLQLYSRIILTYEAAFDLENAVDYSRRVQRHPDASPSQRADALYTEAINLIGLGKYRQAAEAFEAYEKNYPDQLDKEAVLFRAGAQWEQVGPGQAIEFYQRYKKKYPSANADRVIEADHRIYTLMEQQGADGNKLRKQREAIVEDFNRFAQAQMPITATGHQYAAAADFPNLQALYDEYTRFQYVQNEDKDAETTEKKDKMKQDLDARLQAFLSRYQSFEYNSGALYLLAMSNLSMSDLGLSSKCPKNMDEDTCMAYEDALLEYVFPKFYELETAGKEQLAALVQAAKDQKRHSRFVDAAMAELNAREPAQFPAVKRELTGQPDATMPIEFTPIRLEAPEASAPETQPGPVPAPGPGPTPTEAPAPPSPAPVEQP